MFYERGAAKRHDTVVNQSNGCQVHCNSRVSWDLAEKSQILLFAYPNVQRASIQLFMYRGNQFVNFKRLLKVQAIFYQRLSDEMKSLANASITHTTWTVKFVSNLVFSTLFLSMKWLAQFHSPFLGRNSNSGSFLRQQLMIANYRVKKFVRKSQ